MKKRFIENSLALLLSTICLVIPIIKGMELDPDIDALLDDTIFELQAPVPVQEGCFPTESILSLLTPASNPEQNPPVINIVNILKEDIYKKTTGPVTRRSLLDMPGLTPDYFYNNYLTFTAEVFFNYTPKVFFTKNSAFLRDYIDLNNENIINEVSDTEFVNVDVPGVLGLFSTIKLQQYRAGFMFGFARQWNNWLIAGRIPIYYLLENFFLTDEEIQRIQDNPFFRDDDAGIGTSSEDEALRFGLRHLASDRFGAGDARLSLLAHWYHDACQDLWFGMQVTIPTAKAFVRGLIGRDFNPDEQIPPFNLQHFFNVFFCNTNQALANGVIKEELTDFLIDALDRLSTILINAPLGNGKHFGLGPEFDWRYHFSEYFSMHTYASLQAFTAHRENRYYLIEKTESDFDRDWRDPALAGENLALLNRLTVQTLFPVGIRTTIHPGVRFQLNHARMYKSEHWDLSLGFDYWIQGSEEQKNPLPVIPFDLPVNQRKVSRPAAHQGKIFASVGYYGSINHSRYCTDWYVSANTDATVFNKGIGRNYSISIRVGIEF